MHLFSDSRGKVFFRNTGLHTVSFLLIYRSVTRLHYHYLFLFHLSKKVKLIQHRNTHCHDLLLHLFSNVFLKWSSNTKRYSQVIQRMHYSKGKTYEHCHEVYAQLPCPIGPKLPAADSIQAIKLSGSLALTVLFSKRNCHPKM